MTLLSQCAAGNFKQNDVESVRTLKIREDLEMILSNRHYYMSRDLLNLYMIIYGTLVKDLIATEPFTSKDKVTSMPYVGLEKLVNVYS